MSQSVLINGVWRPWTQAQSDAKTYAEAVRVANDDRLPISNVKELDLFFIANDRVKFPWLMEPLRVALAEHMLCHKVLESVQLRSLPDDWTHSEGGFTFRRTYWLGRDLIDVRVTTSEHTYMTLSVLPGATSVSLVGQGGMGLYECYTVARILGGTPLPSPLPFGPTLGCPCYVDRLATPRPQLAWYLEQLEAYPRTSYTDKQMWDRLTEDVRSEELE